MKKKERCQAGNPKKRIKQLERFIKNSNCEIMLKQFEKELKRLKGCSR